MRVPEISSSKSDQKALMTKNSPYRLPPRVTLILINGIVLMYLFLMLNLVTTSDYAYHIEASAAIREGVEVDFPHRLYHYITIVIEAILPGENFKAAGVFTALLSYIILAVVVATSFHRQLRGRHPWQAVALTVALIVTGPMLIFNVFSGTFQQSFIYLHPISYHNPTTTLTRPLALIVFLYGASALLPPVVAWGQVVLAAVITFLLGNAKPSFNLAFVPATFVMLFYRFRKKRFVDYRMFAAIIGVMLLLLAAQYLLTFNTGGASTGVAIEPFAFLMRRGFAIPDILLKHLLSFVLPLTILVLYWTEARTDGPMGLAWVTFLFGLFLELMVIELGDRVDHGNFYWTGEITLFILIFASIHFWLRAMGGKLNFTERRAQIVWGVWGLHLMSGVYWYFLHYTAR